MPEILSLALAIALGGTLRPGPSHRIGMASDVVDSGEEIDLEALFETEVEVATKRSQSLAKAPAVVAVVTAEDLRDRGYQSVAEALRAMPGIYMVDDYVLPNLGVRGIPSGQRAWSRIVKVMIDGFPVPYRPDATNFLGPELVPLDLVKRIEVIRGPGSALYGADAFLGVVNVVTKRGEDLAGTTLAAQGGVFAGHPQGLAALSMGGSLPWGDAEGVLGGSRAAFDRAGLGIPAGSAIAPRWSGQFSDNDTASPASYFGRLGNMTTPLGQLTLEGLYQHLDAGGEFQDWRPFTRQSRIALDNRMIRAALRSQLADRLTTAVSVAYARGNPTAADRIGTGRDDTVIRRDMGTDGVDAAVEGAYALTARDDLSVGADFSQNQHQLPTYYNVFTAASQRAGEEVQAGPDGGEQRFTNMGVYGQGIWHPLEETALTLGVRLDGHNIYGNVFNSRVGLVSGLGSGFTGKVLYGSSFKAPSPQQLFGRPLVFGDILGNEALKPERAQTVEAALTYAPGRQVEVVVDAYYTHVSDRIGFVAQGGNSKAVNQSESDSAGVETELKWRWRTLHGMLNLSVQKTASPVDLEVTAAAEPALPEAYPALMANAGIGAPLGNWPVAAYLESRFVAAVPTSQSNYVANGLTAYELPASTVVDLTFTSREWWIAGGAMVTSVKVANVLDTDYGQPGFGGVDYPGRGRSLWLKVGYLW